MPILTTTNKILVDTSGFFSLYDEADAHHEQAVALYEQAAKRLTTSYVLAEYTALAHVRGVPRGAIIKFSRLILDDKANEIIWVNENLHRQAVALMWERTDKNYLLCDAVSFVVMRQRGIAESLTTDKHFRQEGFVKLLEK